MDPGTLQINRFCVLCSKGSTLESSLFLEMMDTVSFGLNLHFTQCPNNWNQGCTLKHIHFDQRIYSTPGQSYHKRNERVE